MVSVGNWNCVTSHSKYNNKHNQIFVVSILFFFFISFHFLRSHVPIVSLKLCNYVKWLCYALLSAQCSVSHTMTRRHWQKKPEQESKWFPYFFSICAYRIVEVFQVNHQLMILFSTHENLKVNDIEGDEWCKRVISSQWFFTRQLSLILDHVVFVDYLFILFLEREWNCIQISIDLQFTESTLMIWQWSHLPTDDDIWEETNFIINGKRKSLNLIRNEENKLLFWKLPETLFEHWMGEWVCTVYL